MEENYLLFLAEQKQMEVLKRTNDYTCQFRLYLTDSDVKELMVRGKESLIEQQRIEFGPGILEQLIFAFCDSDFIDQAHYAETMARLQDIFYLYKNESLDEMTDEELIHLMREAYDGECKGSLEYLEETYLERFARDIRANTNHFIGRYPKEDD